MPPRGESRRANFLLSVIVLGTAFLVGAEKASSQCWSPNFAPGMVYKTTGDLALDRKFNAEGNLIYRIMGVNPNMVVFDDHGSPNAFASPQITLTGYSGTVYFGLGLLRNQLWSMDKGEAAVAGIMAHEFSHILQLRMGSQLSGKYRELHADFMAGYYLRAKSYLARADIEPFAQSLFETGDYNFRSPAHHGTPEERVSAMKAGFDTIASLTEAFRAGETFVKSGRRSESGGSNSPSDDSAAAYSGGRDVSGSGDFGQTLNSLIQTGAHGFRTLRGALDPDGEGEAWSAKLTLPGARECEVWIYKDRSLGDSYVCDMARSSDLSSIGSEFDALVDKIAQSLPGWSMNDRASSRYIQRYKKFIGGQSKPEVYVQIVGTGSRPYRLQLWISSPSR